MSDFIKRLENELNELNEKLDKLTVFIGTGNFDKLSVQHQKLLLSQQSTMARYSNILSDRLNLSKEEDK